MLCWGVWVVLHEANGMLRINLTHAGVSANLVIATNGHHHGTVPVNFDAAHTIRVKTMTDNAAGYPFF